MTIQRMEHVGIVVDDLAAATALFVELGLKLQGEGPVEGGWVDRVVGPDGVRAEIAMVETPDGHGRLELTKFHAPLGRGGDRHGPANTPGIRHVTEPSSSSRLWTRTRPARTDAREPGVVRCSTWVSGSDASTRRRTSPSCRSSGRHTPACEHRVQRGSSSSGWDAVPAVNSAAVRAVCERARANSSGPIGTGTRLRCSVK
jgi:catechol 2,3-dioxygenase-like lactoylglutathione lyase family enzyme